MTAYLKGLREKFTQVNGGDDCPDTGDCAATCNRANYEAGSATYRCPPSGKGDPEVVGDDCTLLRNHLFLIFL